MLFSTDKLFYAILLEDGESPWSVVRCTKGIEHRAWNIENDIADFGLMKGARDNAVED